MTGLKTRANRSIRGAVFSLAAVKSFMVLLLRIVVVFPFYLGRINTLLILPFSMGTSWYCAAVFVLFFFLLNAAFSKLHVFIGCS